MIDQLTLDTALDTPEGATLVSSHGTVTLLHVRHAHADQVCIERYPLGAAIEVAQLVRLLGSLGLLPAPAETPGLPAPAAAPMAAAADSTVACPDCGTRTTPRGMGYHRRHAHGVVGEEAARRQKAEAGDVLCPDCARAFVSPRALHIHQSRTHGAPEAPPAPPAPPAPAAVTKDGRTPARERTKADTSPDRGSCEICGQAWAGHPRCGDCAALIGAGHAAHAPAAHHGPYPLCATCARRRKLIPANVQAVAA